MGMADGAVQVGSNGRVTIPVDVRREKDISEGEWVQITVSKLDEDGQ